MKPACASHVWAAWTTDPKRFESNDSTEEHPVVFVYVRECCVCGVREEI